MAYDHVRAPLPRQSGLEQHVSHQCLNRRQTLLISVSSLMCCHSDLGPIRPQEDSEAQRQYPLKRARKLLLTALARPPRVGQAAAGLFQAISVESFEPHNVPPYHPHGRRRHQIKIVLESVGHIRSKVRSLAGGECVSDMLNHNYYESARQPQRAKSLNRGSPQEAKEVAHGHPPSAPSSLASLRDHTPAFRRSPPPFLYL